MQTMHIVFEHRNRDGELTDYQKFEIDDVYTALYLTLQFEWVNLSDELRAAAQAYRDSWIDDLPEYVRRNQHGFAGLTRAERKRIPSEEMRRLARALGITYSAPNE